MQSELQKKEPKVLIYTVVDEKYRNYVELFLKSCEISFPEYDVQIRFGGPWEPSESRVIPNQYIDLPNNKATYATLRFCTKPEGYEKYDYVYITDIDMVLIRDSMLLHEKHLRAMELRGLIEYENTAYPIGIHGYRMPGVHFVTRDYWDKTEEQRGYQFERLKDANSARYREYDECTLYRIVHDSGLKITNKGHEEWRWHGVHLGRYLKRDGRFPVKKLHSAIERKNLVSFYTTEMLWKAAWNITEQDPDMRSILTRIAQLVGK